MIDINMMPKTKKKPPKRKKPQKPMRRWTEKASMKRFFEMENKK